MVRIITDSAADFEPAELTRMNITCIPLTVIFGDTAYQENIDLSKEQFYEKLAQPGACPKTAQPSPQLLLDHFTNASAHDDEAVYITLSSKLSGTYQCARMIREDLGSKHCHVVDGLSATAGQRLLVEHAVKLRDEGKSAAEIVKAVKDLRSRITIYACVDTLDYLFRGGRLSRTSYAIGSIAKIKPIIRVDDGAVTVPSKAIGMRKAMDYLCKRLDAVPRDPDFPLYIVYSADRTNAEALAQRLDLDIPTENLLNLGAAIGTHVGPNACGLVYVAKK